MQPSLRGTRQTLLPGINPDLPDALRPLVELAYNLHWSFSARAWALFERLGADAWARSGHNPVRLLAELPADRIAALAATESFLVDVTRAHKELAEHMLDGGWFASQVAAGAVPQAHESPFLAAYFCAEFGITECFQIYSGGLGLLAGDHLKAATELGLPLIAVGLLYRNGYFHQRLDDAGMQVEQFPPLDPVRQPVRRVMDLESGRQLTIPLAMPGRTVHCAVWRADVGKVRLYLLDTNLPENSAEDREITANLYLGDQNRRIQQELVLGVAGVRALQAVGESPTVFHMNEGHAAFLALERIRAVRERTGLSFDQAREAVASAHVFTTHTPVPAGIDHFNVALVQHYFAGYHEQLGLDMEGFMALGRERVEDKNEAFSMAILAIRCSRFANGVSRLHGEVSRRMWARIWPDTPVDDVPIGHVTNGIHPSTWLSPVMGQLYDKHLPADWRSRPQDESAWAGIDRAADAELWAARAACRQRLVRWCQEAAKRGMTGGTPCQLDPAALTIGFARRFAGYKRGTLLFRDVPRLKKILGSAGNRPVQFIISGKSHPGDGWGKHLIRDVVEFARSANALGRVLFVEDYDIGVARELVRGCDVWLNTPIRGLEASGTSGMKAALNGVLHASILDGWWDEGYAPDAGFKIEDSGIYPSDAPNEERESFEADALYRLIEQQIVPDFYTHDAAGVPTRWTARMRRCIRTMAPLFSTHRMVAEYATKYYFPAHAAGLRMGADAAQPARRLADQIDRYRRLWPQIRVKHVDAIADAQGFAVSASVRLGTLRPDELLVQVYHGPTDDSGNIPVGRAVTMTAKAPLAGGDGTYHFTARIALKHSPSDAAQPYAVLVRVLPGDDALVTPFIPGLITASQPVLAEAEGARV